MAFTLEQVVPWGRSFDEYRRMFSLADRDLEQPVLGCADGPASFNAEATRRGACVVSCDPLYRFGVSSIRRRIEETRERVLEQTRANSHEFVWDAFASIDELAAVRREAMDDFLDDFEAGRAQGRYIDGELPHLPFADRSFAMALCSHFLFLYSEQLSSALHEAAIAELCRVASEVRVFPLIALDGEPSLHAEPIVRHARKLGLEVAIDEVPYEFQRGGNRMMRVWQA